MVRTGLLQGNAMFFVQFHRPYDLRISTNVWMDRADLPGFASRIAREMLDASQIFPRNVRR